VSALVSPSCLGVALMVLAGAGVDDAASGVSGLAARPCGGRSDQCGLRHGSGGFSHRGGPWRVRGGGGRHRGSNWRRQHGGMGGGGQAHRDRGRRDQHCSPTTNGDAGNPGELAVLERGAHLRSGYAPPPRKPDEGCVKKVEGPYGWRVDGRDRISGPPQRDPDAATLTTQGARSQRCELTILRTPLPAAECALAGLAPEARRLNSAIGALRRPLARSLPPERSASLRRWGRRAQPHR